MQTWQENRRKAIFYFSKYSVSLSQSSVDTIGKLKAIGKITYIIFQGRLTPWTAILKNLALSYFLNNWSSSLNLEILIFILWKKELMQLLRYFQADWIYIIQNRKECVFWKCLLVALCFSLCFTLYMGFKKICIKMWKCAKSLISFTWDFNMNVQAFSGNFIYMVFWKKSRPLFLYLSTCSNSITFNRTDGSLFK